jgi:hypothetical protein
MGGIIDPDSAWQIEQLAGRPGNSEPLVCIVAGAVPQRSNWQSTVPFRF